MTDEQIEQLLTEMDVTFLQQKHELRRLYRIEQAAYKCMSYLAGMDIRTPEEEALYQALCEVRRAAMGQ